MSTTTMAAELLGSARVNRERWRALRLAVVEDQPRSGSNAFVDQLSDAVEDGWAMCEEGVVAAEQLQTDATDDAEDTRRLRRSLRKCGAAVQALGELVAVRMLGHERSWHLASLAALRGEWSSWAPTVAELVDDVARGTWEWNAAIVRGWSDLSEGVGAYARAEATGQRLTLGDEAMERGGLT